MVNSLPEVSSHANPPAGASQHQNSAAAVAEQIRTNSAEQTTARNVEKVEKIDARSSELRPDPKEAQEMRDRLQEMLNRRAASTHAQETALEADRDNRAQEAKMRRALAQINPEVRDGGTAEGNVSRIDVSG
ncbi:MAG: hypothetical protein HQM06_10600 [Magnetococcales bacterium]|nr:hypothetical protein [Magnetococcales bacterium]